MSKRLILHLVTLLLISLLVSASIIIIQVAACHKKREYCFDCDDNDYDGCEARWRIRRLVIKCLKELACEISELPDEAFENSEHADCEGRVLRWKVCVVIWQVFVGAYEGALNKLENDVRKRIEQWIADCWKTCLIKKVDYIIELIRNLLCRKDWRPPEILGVLQYPTIPNYDESVAIIAHVVDDHHYHCYCDHRQSGVKSVILSYSVNLISWSNVTMNLVDGLYFAEILPLPYNTTVNYKIYAYDWACNLAISELYSYVVADSYPPLISYVDRVPPSPYYNKTVSILANVTEPPEASGVKNVTLLYRVDGEWQLVEMTLGDTLYTGVIPAFPYGTTVQYKVRASDWAENWATSDIYSYTVGVPPNLPPVANFTESAETVDTGEVITFDATNSYDPDGVIVRYFWHFGDGSNATGVTVNHAYADDGNYNVILTVIDDDGATATDISTKTVLNRPPVASFTESATTVLTNEVINFDATDSDDPDGSIIVYIWDFGDGSEATGVTASHAYEDNGVYNVTLKVIDDDGAIALKSASKTISNRPPVASFTENVTTVDTGEAIHFDASNSSDSDGFIVSYFWDFGDGTNATGVTVDHAYDEAGNYTVTLTVTDDDGATDNVTSIKTVLKGKAEVSWALFAALGLGIIALIATLIYLWYRRRRKRTAAGAAAGPSTRPLITLYIPPGILAVTNKTLIEQVTLRSSRR